MEATRKTRTEAALWGLFIGDSLAMPAHWYYSLENLKRDFDGGVTGYTDPPHPHAESFMSGSAYSPDGETAKRHGRPYDILHEHARFYNTSYGKSDIRLSEQESQHGHDVPAAEERYHYHHGLKSGENTLGANLALKLMESVTRSGKYAPETFLEAFINHMTTPGANRDPYVEIYIREWFEHYALGYPVDACAQQQRRNWSIGSHGGMVRPMLLSLIAPSCYQGIGLAVEHQQLTHRSENVTSGLYILIPLLYELLDGADPAPAILNHAKKLRLPKITGEALFEEYKSHHGPGNIDPVRMWELHTRLSDEPFDLEKMVKEKSDEEVIRTLIATACYPEHGVPLILYLLYKYRDDFEACLLANVNAGGDNVHRGMLLGMLAGAMAGTLPPHLQEGLANHATLRPAIAAFSAVASKGSAI